MKNILILFICSALLTPILEQVVVGFDLISDSDFSSAELVENEEDSKESEEEKENEIEEAELIQWPEVHYSRFELAFTQLGYRAKSHIREIPSPPPDSLS